MPAFFEYLRNITYYLIFLAVVGMITPSGSYKKYITLIMGILLIGIVITPITSIINRTQLPMTEIFGNIIPTQTHIEDNSFMWQQDQIKSAFHSQLTIQLDALLTRNGYALISADWETSDDFTYIRRIHLSVKVIESAPERIPFIRVEPVRVAPYQPSEEPAEVLAIKNLISDFYNMPPDNIHVEIRVT